MATAKECDACGSFFKLSTDPTEANGITLAYFDIQGRVQNTIRKIELCPECLEKVKTVLNLNDTTT